MVAPRGVLSTCVRRLTNTVSNEHLKPAGRTAVFPHGARGLRIAGAALIAAKDKLVFASPDRTQHLTLHFGSISGDIDLHETTISSDGHKTYRTLFRMPRANLGSFAEELRPTAINEIRRVVRRLRPGWMVRRDIGAVLGFPVPAEAMDRVTIRLGDKAEIDPARLAAEMRVPEYIDELYSLPHGSEFSLFDWRNPGAPRLLGLGFVIVMGRSDAGLIWMRFRELTRALRSLTPVLRDLALRHGAEFPEVTA